MGSPEKIDVYLEIGKKAAIAGAVDWPGWCRQAKDEASALAALVTYGPRYQAVLSRSRVAFSPPADEAGLRVVERIDGSSTTDFGVPDAAPEEDARPMHEEDATRLRALLRASWRAFDRAVTAAEGKELRKGPRGGGRDLDKIVAHLAESDESYLRRVGLRLPKDAPGAPETRMALTRELMLEALDVAVRGETPERGPRGGKLWTARYLVRRAMWHTLDHAWEIEDRVVDG